MMYYLNMRSRDRLIIQTSQRIQMNFTRPRAKKVIQGIFTAMNCGKWFTKQDITLRFINGGYGGELATRYADALIAANTGINHFSRWEVRGTKCLVYRTYQ